MSPNRKLKSKIVEQYGTQSDFAQALGADDSRISRVVCGRRIIPSEEQKRWAEKLGTTPEELFT